MATADNLDTDVRIVDAGETLSTGEKIGYGLGDAGGHCISDLISGFLLFFYTDVFGLSPAIVGAQQGDVITLHLPMTIRRVYANPLVRHNAGKVAIQRGPLVYCLEEVDNGSELHNLSLPKESELREIQGTGVLKGKVVLQAEGLRVLTAQQDKPLYSFDHRQTAVEKQTLTFIPWFR